MCLVSSLECFAERAYTVASEQLNEPVPRNNLMESCLDTGRSPHKNGFVIYDAQHCESAFKTTFERLLSKGISAFGRLANLTLPLLSMTGANGSGKIAQNETQIANVRRLKCLACVKTDHPRLWRYKANQIQHDITNYTIATQLVSWLTLRSVSPWSVIKRVVPPATMVNDTIHIEAVLRYSASQDCKPLLFQVGYSGGSLKNEIIS